MTQYWHGDKLFSVSYLGIQGFMMKPTKLYYASDILRFHHCIFNYSLSLLVLLLALWQGCRPVASSRQCFLLFVLLLALGTLWKRLAWCLLYSTSHPKFKFVQFRDREESTAIPIAGGLSVSCNYCELSPSLGTEFSQWLHLPCTNSTDEQPWPGCQSILWEMPKERPVEEEVAGNA